MRHDEKFGFELSGVHGRKFDQRADFVEQRGDVLLGAERGAEFGGPRAQLALGLGASRVERGDDLAVRRERFFVSVGAGDGNVSDALEAMPVGEPACFQSEYGNVDDVAVVECDQAMRRAHELHRGRAVGELVAHHLWYRQLGDRFLQRDLQAGGERGARYRLFEEGVFGVAFDSALELSHRGPFLFQAFGERSARLAVGAERDFGGHQLLRLGSVRGLGPHIADQHGQSARCGEKPRVAEVAVLQLRPDQRILQALAEGIAELLQRFRRQLLGEQFYQQAGIHAAASRCSGRP